ncbi:uncharacterized protein K441DRAFT_586290, partial [Cenococcum geophilum 1.58]|uniref:uncharacterized protein n=1 Tax=Cenococcum geophilum 1.58 TaxID=794803 RepID=UPI00358F5551
TATANEFSGTEHWYNCANGHPSTVGECGRPVEKAKCTICGALVGGVDDGDEEGVTRADGLEKEALQ